MARLVQGAPSLSRTHLSSCVPDLPPRYYVTTRRVASVKLSRAWQLVVYQVICFHIAIFFHSKEIRREKTISIWSRFVRQTSDAPARYKNLWKPLYITSEYAHAYVLSNNWKQRNELDLSSTKIHTRIEFNN